MLIDAPFFVRVGRAWCFGVATMSHECRGDLPSNLTRRVRNGGEICKAAIHLLILIPVFAGPLRTIEIAKTEVFAVSIWGWR